MEGVGTRIEYSMHYRVTVSCACKTDLSLLAFGDTTYKLGSCTRVDGNNKYYDKVVWSNLIYVKYIETEGCCPNSKPECVCSGPDWSAEQTHDWVLKAEDAAYEDGTPYILPEGTSRYDWSVWHRNYNDLYWHGTSYGLRCGFQGITPYAFRSTHFSNVHNPEVRKKLDEIAALAEPLGPKCDTGEAQPDMRDKPSPTGGGSPEPCECVLVLPPRTLSEDIGNGCTRYTRTYKYTCKVKTDRDLDDTFKTDVESMMEIPWINIRSFGAKTVAGPHCKEDTPNCDGACSDRWIVWDVCN